MKFRRYPNLLLSLLTVLLMGCSQHARVSQPAQVQEVSAGTLPKTSPDKGDDNRDECWVKIGSYERGDIFGNRCTRAHRVDRGFFNTGEPKVQKEIVAAQFIFNYYEPKRDVYSETVRLLTDCKAEKYFMGRHELRTAPMGKGKGADQPTANLWRPFVRQPFGIEVKNFACEIAELSQEKAQ